MLNLYRCHAEDCPHRDKGQNHTKCSCPIWCYGQLNTIETRRSVKTRDWMRAVKRVEAWESSPERAAPTTTLAGAVAAYVADCQVRNLTESTIASYEKTIEHLMKFSGARQIDEVDLDLLSSFRESRKVAPSTSGKELETLPSVHFALSGDGWNGATRVR
jgi:hypothetical protein